MTWLLAVMLYLLFFSLASPVLKLMADKLPRAKALSVLFFICAISIWIFTLVTKSVQFGAYSLIIFGVGFVIAFGAYSQWRAYAHSLSKSVLFIPLISIVAMGLAVLFLGEASLYKNFWLTPGIILLLAAAFLFSKGEKKEGEKVGSKWLLFIVGMVLIQGGATFAMKYFSDFVPRMTFFSYWYLGAAFGSLPILLLERGDTRKFFQRRTLLIPLASILILATALNLYQSLGLTFAAVVLPIQAFGIIFLPILVGWLFFHETRELTKKNIIGFVCGIVGVSLIILSQVI